MPVALIGPASLGVSAGVLAENVFHDTGRAVAIAVSVAGTVALARWVWKAILRQMRAEIISVNQSSLDDVVAGNKEAIAQLGSELGRKLDDLSTRNDEQHAENGGRLGLLETRMHGVETGQAELAGSADAVRAVISHLSTLQGEVALLRKSRPHPTT